MLSGYSTRGGGPLVWLPPPLYIKLPFFFRQFSHFWAPCYPISDLRIFLGDLTGFSKVRKPPFPISCILLWLQACIGNISTISGPFYIHDIRRKYILSEYELTGPSRNRARIFCCIMHNMNNGGGCRRVTPSRLLPALEDFSRFVPPTSPFWTLCGKICKFAHSYTL